MTTRALDAFSVPLDGACLVEASAGTGKTFTLARLYLRLVLERDIPVEDILAVTFTEAATAELRARVRHKLMEAAAFFSGGQSDDELLRKLRDAADPRLLRVRAQNALRDFDLAAISTIHGFCDRMLHENAFESGEPFDQELMPDIDPLLEEIVHDFCARTFLGPAQGSFSNVAVDLKLEELLKIAKEAVRRPEAVPRAGEPADPPPRLAKEKKRSNRSARNSAPERASLSPPAEEEESWRETARFRLELVEEVRRELVRRKRKLRIFSYDDMLQRLARALEGPGGEHLAERIRQKYRAALIDEFQDTDPVQYRIFRKVFIKEGTPLFLVGDPKQSIYRFRGADVFAYLAAAGDAGRRLLLEKNFRSDPSLIAATNRLFSRLAQKTPPFVLEGIDFSPVAPKDDAADRLRIGGRAAPPMVLEFLPWSKERGQQIISKDWANENLPQWLAGEIASLLAANATIDDRPLSARDVAVLTRSNDQALWVQAALRERGLPSVLVTERSVFGSDEARALFRVLAAAANPQDVGGLRGALASELIGLRGEDFLAFDHDERAFEIWIERAREWRRRWRERGVLSLVFALLDLRVSPDGPSNAARLLSLPGGERRLTNLRHLAELAHREEIRRGLGPESLLSWFERQMQNPGGGEEAELRLESDEDAVRISTIHKAKGLEYPVVFCPFLWDTGGDDKKQPFLGYHDPAQDRQPVIDIATPLAKSRKDDDSPARRQADREALSESMRLLYVAITRAQHQCRILCGRIGKEWHRSALAHLLFRPALGPEATPEEIKKRDDGALRRILEELEAASGGAITVEEFRLRPEPATSSLAPASAGFTCRERRRVLVSAPLSTSYSQMVASEARPSDKDRDPAPDDPAWASTAKTVLAASAEERVPLADFPAGTGTGYLFHSIFEKMELSDADGSSLGALVSEELARHGFERERFAPVVERAVRSVVRAALDPQDPSLRLASLDPRAQLRELPFVLPADLSRHGAEAARVLARILREYGGGGAAAYAGRLEALSLPQVRGFLRGVMDLVFCHQGRWFVLDYKTNLLGPAPSDYRAEALERAMAEHHYFLQAYLYLVALNRYLAHRLADYRPEHQLGGVYYLFVRGMGEERSPGAGVFFERPPLQLIRELDRLLCLPPGGKERP